MELVRETPPPSRRANDGRVDWREIAEKLRADPGEWFVVREAENDPAARIAASRISCGRASGFERGEFEAVARRVDGVTKAYARFVGAP